MIKKVLTIAGSDCSGGAGIQADIKTITVHKMYAMSVLTALTAQNTLGVTEVLDINPNFVASQLDSVFTDIRPDAVKIGMVSNVEIIKVIASKLKEYEVKNIVVDPVMVSTSGHNLISEEAKETLINYLLPLGIVITPNIPEAEVLSNTKIVTKDDMIKAGEIISKKINANVLVKGGHSINDATDLLYRINGDLEWFNGEKIDNENTHGTGCTLSSSIACNLANEYNLKDSIQNAKDYLTGAIKSNLNIGNGKGPLNHTYNI